MYNTTASEVKEQRMMGRVVFLLRFLHTHLTLRSLSRYPSLPALYLMCEDHSFNHFNFEHIIKAVRSVRRCLGDSFIIDLTQIIENPGPSLITTAVINTLFTYTLQTVNRF